MAKKKATIKKKLEQNGFTVIERDGTLVLAQELQKDTLTFDDGSGDSFDYPPFVHDFTYDTMISDEVAELTGDTWYWECEYPTCFKLYRA